MKERKWQLNEYSKMMGRRAFIVLVIVHLLVLKFAAQRMNVQTYNMRDGLSQMKVSCLFEDSRGYIWVGTRNGLNRFNGADFQIFTTDDGLLNNRILGVREDENGAMLIVTAGGVSVYDGLKFNNFPHGFSRVFYKFQQDDSGYLYIFSRDLFGFHATKGVYKIYDEVHHFGLDSKSEKILGLTTDSVLQLSNGMIQHRSFYKSKPRFWSQNPIISDQILAYDSFHQDSFFTFNLEGKLWVPKSVAKYKQDKPPTVDHCYQDSLVLISGEVYKLPMKRGSCLLKSKTNNYFVGTDEGLIRYYPTAFQKVSVEQLPYAWSIIDSEERMLFGDYGGGLIEMNKATRKFKKINEVEDLYHCGASTNGAGTFYFSNNQGLIKLIKNELKLVNLNCSVLYNIYDAHRKSVVLGINFGLAIEDSTGKVIFKNEKGLFHDNHYIQNITIGPEYNYWCGSYFGLTKYNPDKESYIHFTSQQNNLPVGPGVFCGLLDSQNRLWLGGNKGLCWYDNEEQKLIKVNTPLLDEQIKSIIELSPGTLLLGSKNELMTFKSQLYFDEGIVDVDYYNTTNGYEGIEPGYTGFYRDQEANIWLTSSSHTSYLSFPYQLKENEVLRAQILSVDEQPIRFSKKNDTIELHTNENIVINVEAVGLDRPSMVKYALRVDGGTWTTRQPENQFVLDKLKHGHHVVEVAAGPGAKSDAGLAMSHLIVALPLFQRDFFLPTLLSILALFVLYTTYIWWKRRLERQQYLMQVEESRYLRSQLLLSELNPHFIFNVLASIQNKILKGEKDEANSKLVQLSSLIRNFLNVSFKSNDPKNKLEHEITLDREIELLTSYLEFERSNSNDHFDFTIQIHERCEPTQIMIPPMLIQPYVENAVKHGVLPMQEKGRIELHFYYEENVLFCEILDNGKGIEHSKRQSKHATHVSLGSTIVKERIDALNQIGYQIEVRIEQREVGGTSVQLTIQE